VTRRAIDATPEALFATLLDGLREIHARDGMSGVTGAALAVAAGIHSTPERDSALAALDRPRTPLEPPAAGAFGAIEAALEDAFGRGGPEEAIGELSRIGAELERAARARMAGRHRPGRRAQRAVRVRRRRPRPTT
jgi:hypothetical protein